MHQIVDFVAILALVAVGAWAWHTLSKASRPPEDHRKRPRMYDEGRYRSEGKKLSGFLLVVIVLILTGFIGIMAFRTIGEASSTITDKAFPKKEGKK